MTKDGDEGECNIRACMYDRQFKKLGMYAKCQLKGPFFLLKIDLLCNEIYHSYFLYFILFFFFFFFLVCV